MADDQLLDLAEIRKNLRFSSTKRRTDELHKLRDQVAASGR